MATENEEGIAQNMSWSSNEIRIGLSNSLFRKIPNEIIIKIFRHLSVPDLCHVSLVCRSFQMIADLDEIWKPKCNISMKLHSKSYKQIYIEWMNEKIIRNKKLLDLDAFYMGRTGCVICTPPTYPRRAANEHRFVSIGGFDKHPNSTQEMTIELSVDIDRTAPELVSLLEKASSHQEQWQQPAVLKQMIQRYYRFMQLKAANPNTLLIPTLDIEIVWQTHILRPEMYRNDCLRLFHQIIDHSLVIKNEMERFFKRQAFLDTCQLYEQRFNETYCALPASEAKAEPESYVSFRRYELRNVDKPIYSYWDETHFSFAAKSPSDYENPFSFTQADIILDLKWFNACKEFMHKAINKVSVRGYYSSSQGRIDLGEGALKRLKKSYERFLYMAAQYPLKDGNGFIPPTYAIDVIWHSHMQEPLNYEADCLRLVGYVIYHDPWPIVEDEKMKKSCDQVDQIWKNEFQCEIELDHLYNTSDNNSNWFG